MLKEEKAVNVSTILTSVDETKPTEVEAAKVVDTESDAKAFIYHKESGNVACKINGGAVDCEYDGHLACGIGQSLPCQKLTSVCHLSDYACQDTWFSNYAINRYGSWNNAKKFWEANKWW